MIIKNFTKLASTPERKIALDVANAGIEAITPDKVIKENIRLDKSVLTIKNKSFDLKEIKNIYVIGVGKAAFETGSALEKVLGDKITEGILLDINKGKLKHLESFVGTHPLPSQENIR
ncbi:MAG: DUF4147 domain-containing protein, partial [Candidatus Paceibacterota bacterium]